FSLLSYLLLYILSLHDALPIFCTHEHTFLLLGGRETAEQFLEKMSWYGLDHLEAAAGRDLSYEEEVFFRGTIRELTSELLSGLSDRKSTRLNSSHVSNSYAFFC